MPLEAIFWKGNIIFNSKINNLTGLGVCSCRGLPQRRSVPLPTKKRLSSRSIQPRLWLPERMESEGILSQGNEPSILPATQKRVQKRIEKQVTLKVKVAQLHSFEIPQQGRYYNVLQRAHGEKYVYWLHLILSKLTTNDDIFSKFKKC